MEIIIASPEQIEEIVSKCIAGLKVPNNSPDAAKKSHEMPISAKETRDRFGWSRAKEWRLRKNDKIKAHIFNGMVYYFESEIIESIKKA